MSWWSLYVKEIRLSKTRFLLNVIFLVMSFVLIIFLMEKYNPLFFMLTIPIAVFHFFYMFFAMIEALRAEWKQKTTVFWLNIPQSGWSLLTAKFAAAASQLVVSLSATFLFMFTMSMLSSRYFSDPIVVQFFQSIFQSFWFYIFVGIIVASLQAGTVSTFIFMMAKTVRHWGWLLGIAIMVALSWLWSIIQSTAIYRALTEWGVILDGEKIANAITGYFDDFTVDPDIQLSVQNDAMIYVGSTMVELLIIVAVLYASAWLLDHKVDA